MALKCDFKDFDSEHYEGIPGIRENLCAIQGTAVCIDEYVYFIAPTPCDQIYDGNCIYRIGLDSTDYAEKIVDVTTFFQEKRIILNSSRLDIRYINKIDKTLNFIGKAHVINSDYGDNPCGLFTFNTENSELLNFDDMFTEPPVYAYMKLSLNIIQPFADIKTILNEKIERDCWARYGKYLAIKENDNSTWLYDITQTNYVKQIDELYTDAMGVYSDDKYCYILSNVKERIDKIEDGPYPDYNSMLLYTIPKEKIFSDEIDFEKYSRRVFDFNFYPEPFDYAYDPY